jgi:hypothetical protein
MTHIHIGGCPGHNCDVTWNDEHCAFAAGPGWVDDLAELLHRDPRLADWRQAVFLTALAGGAVDPAEAVRLAAAAPLPTTRPVRTP